MTSGELTMRQVPLERDINIVVNGCTGFATSTQKGPFMAMLISRSRGTYLITLVSMCILPGTAIMVASEAIAASK